MLDIDPKGRNGETGQRTCEGVCRKVQPGPSEVNPKSYHHMTVIIIIAAIMLIYWMVREEKKAIDSIDERRED
jgi:hypothetical protein